jgi:hypothetical protein
MIESEEYMSIDPQDFSTARWFKSTHSEPSEQCVEAAFAGGYVGVRDTKDRKSAQLIFTNREWRAFLHAAKLGQYDR